MTKTFRQREAALTSMAKSSPDLPERLRAQSRLIRLMGQRSDLAVSSIAILREAADRIEELEDVRRAHGD